MSIGVKKTEKSHRRRENEKKIEFISCDIARDR